ncbi:hypothetical protein BC629DRAFT_235265 [Irpex lacteus]|nr:hypothetical protein BC629DRAFT_235265 [Irpex lacteus]
MLIAIALRSYEWCVFVSFVAVALRTNAPFSQYSITCEDLGTHRTVRTPPTAAAKDVPQYRRHSAPRVRGGYDGRVAESMEERDKDEHW